jgi:hypothetical protein
MDGSFLLLGGCMVMGAVTTTAAFGFFGTRTPPNERKPHRKNDGDWDKLLPVHDVNITAKTRGANGIFGGGLQSYSFARCGEHWELPAGGQFIRNIKEKCRQTVKAPDFSVELWRPGIRLRRWPNLFVTSIV